MCINITTAGDNKQGQFLVYYICQECIEAGESKDIIISIDGGKWYQKKVNEVLSQVRGDSNPTETIPLLPTTGWRNFPSACLPPSFCYGSIYEHIISTATQTSLGQNFSDSEEDNNITDFHISKPMLKGRQFFNSGHVKNIKHQQKGSYQFFKCHVMASYSIQTIYNVT